MLQQESRLIYTDGYELEWRGSGSLHCNVILDNYFSERDKGRFN